MSDASQDRLAGLTREQRAALFEQVRKRKEQQAPAEPPAERIPRRPADRDTAPASFAQERLWFLDRLAPGKTVFNIPLALRIEGNLSPAHLEGVLRALIGRHETLRTRFAERDGQPVQIVEPPGPWSLPVVDLESVPTEARDAEMRRLAQEDVERPFDLERGPLLRAVLLRFGPSEHALLLDMHHIISDGWSMGVLVRDITALYGNLALPELPVQYADFALWQRGWLSGETLERQIAWWREALAGAPASLDLPTDRPRPAAQTYLGTRLQVPFDGALSHGLAQFARRHEATPYMVFLAAFQALLGRASGQDDLTVGSPIANRHRAEVEPLIGFFVNTQVMRGDLRGDPTFRELLARARRSTLGAFAHQDLPFERLVVELRPERHLSVTPLFQVVCAMQNAPVGSMTLPGLTLDRIPFEITTSQFDLELHLWEMEGGAYLGDLSFSTELFDPPTILRLVARLETLLRGVTSSPGLRLSELPLLPESEHHQILHEWNDTSPPLPGRGTRADRERGPGGEGSDLLTMVLANAPEALLDRASRLAGDLRKLGVGPEVPVGLCVERSPELVLGALAVLLAGGAYLPLDPAWPEDRLAFVVGESGMPVLLGKGESPAWAGAVRWIDLDRPSQAEPVQPLPPDPDRLAYVIYTSGSTGRPKGVQILHRGLLSLVSWHLRTYGVTREDRATLVASPAFDASVWEIWPYLAAGASLHVPDADLRLQPERLLAWMAEEGITISFLPTPLAEQVLDAAETSIPDSIPGGLQLRALLTGGDRLQSAPRRPLPFALVNHYGPTESSVVATCALVEPGSSRAPVIGRPIEGTRAYVVDALLQSVPIGIPGELVLAGTGLARGYLGRSDLTAERFVPDPFSESPGGRLYRTGDLVRHLADGSLDFLGRVDTQVKLRGFRIELGEIESVLLRHPAVREAVVTLREDTGLAAYVVLRTEPARDDGEIEEHISEWQTLYDETYAKSDRKDATFDIEGWNSSYTGEPIPAEEMRDWVERTVERIQALHPRRVVEIGCGTGLLLFRVAPQTESYLGIDFSRVALEGIRRRLDDFPHVGPQVELRQGEADDWSGIPQGEADLVILNSVSQYFPGIDYLVRVLEGAVKALRPGGAIFAGDIRSLPLLEAFAESVERFQASPSRSEEEIQQRIRRRVAGEEELVVDPRFFEAFAERIPGVTGVDLLAKQSRWDNELTRYRYDVILSTAGASPAFPDVHRPVSGLSGEQLSDLPWSAFANDPLGTRLARQRVPELRRHLRSELPDYMVPSAFVFLEALPVTANGKVDRAALPEPELVRGADEGTPPETPTERAMAGLWKEVLGVSDVHREDNFFDLGGHSLLATQLVSRIRAAFGQDLPLRRVFEHPVLGDLAAALEKETASIETAPAPLASGKRRTEAPLSLAQERFWYFGRAGNPAYNVPLSLWMRGPLDADVLERCFREILRRHDTLRSRFIERDGEPVQIVEPPKPWFLPRIDLTALAKPVQKLESERLLTDDAARPFDLGRGPVLRVALMRLAPDEHVLLLDFHHIVTDGWGQSVFVSELLRLYAAFAAGRPSPLPELPRQVTDLAVWQRERVLSPAFRERLDWWKKTLQGSPRLWAFPTDRPRPAKASHRGAWMVRVLPADLMARLKALAVTEGASLYMVMLAALTLLIGSWSGEEDVVVGSPLAGRERGESESLIGVFLNLVPMRIDLSGNPTFRDLLGRARRTALDAYSHQEVSFERLLEAVGLERESSHYPLFQCTLNMLTFPSMGGDLPGGAQIEPILVGKPGSKYDFTLYGEERSEGLILRLLYAADLFDSETMEALQNQLRAVLELAVEHPETPIQSFPVGVPRSDQDVVA